MEHQNMKMIDYSTDKRLQMDSLLNNSSLIDFYIVGIYAIAYIY